MELTHYSSLTENSGSKKRKWNFSKHGITPPKKMAANDGKHDQNEITLEKLNAKLQGMQSDSNKRLR